MNERRPSPRQTQSYLRRLLTERGLRPQKKRGQNFLVDLNLLEVLLRSAELTPQDVVLEVGAGTGSLTARLAQQAGSVLSVEIDPAFAALAQETVGSHANVRLIQADVLRNKNELNPEVMAQLDELERRAPAGHRLKLVANLPYAVATPVLGNLLVSNRGFERMVMTVQWEIAERLAAQPGAKVYGALSVLVQSLATVEIVRRLPPSVFWPRPLVDSAIVLIRPDPARRQRVGDPVRFRNFLRDLYTQRRKNLRAALAGRPGGRRDKHEVDQKLQALGMAGTRRAEELTVEDHLRLCSAFG